VFFCADYSLGYMLISFMDKVLFCVHIFLEVHSSLGGDGENGIVCFFVPTTV